MIVKVRDNQSRYLDTRNLTVESSRKKGEIRGPKDFTGHCAYIYKCRIFFGRDLSFMLASREFTEMVI